MNIAIVLIAAVQCAVLIIWAWTLGVTFIGTRTDAAPKEAAEILRPRANIAVFICAHNEGRVIRGLLESLKTQTYPTDYWKVFLIADRCTDDTCLIAEQYHFVTILRREEQGESRKGLALQWGIQKIQNTKQEPLDMIMVLDADNQVIPEFLELFNERYRKGSLLITGKRVAMNPYQTLISKWYAIYWSVVTELFCQSHCRLGLSALLSGTGFAFSASLLGEYGFHTLSMSEDIEFSIQQNLKGICVDYLAAAIFYDEQPVTLKTMVRQLRRWTTGCYQIVRRYAGSLLKKLLKKPSLMIGDSFLSLLLCASLGAMIVSGIGTGCIAIIKGGVYIVSAFLMTAISGGLTILIGYTAVRRSGLSASKLLSGIVLFPVFYLLFSCVALYSLFCPQKKWHKIEHYGFGQRKIGRENE